MTIDEQLFEDIFTEEELKHSTESARKNIEKVLASNPNSFSQKYSMPNFNSVYQRAKAEFQANKNLSKQQLAVESYCIEMNMLDSDKIKLIRLLKLIS